MIGQQIDIEMHRLMVIIELAIIIYDEMKSNEKTNHAIEHFTADRALENASLSFSHHHLNYSSTIGQIDIQITILMDKMR